MNIDSLAMRISRWSLYGLLALIPIGTRKFMFAFTPEFQEYQSAFFYVSDVALFVFCVATLVMLFLRWNTAHLFAFYRKRWTLGALLAFIFFAVVSVGLAASKMLALYALLRLMLVVVTGLCAAYVIGARIVSIDTIFSIIVGSAVVQSLIGFFQFIQQSSLGLRWLGESVLHADAPGIAKVVYAGAAFIRAYGTFPHPNVLAAFLLGGFIGVAYLFFESTNQCLPAGRQESVTNLRTRYLLLIVALFFILLGLLLTFSRTAWMIGVCTFAAIVWWASRKSALRALVIQYALGVSFSALLLSGIFYPFVFARARLSVADEAVVARTEYLRIGFAIVRAHPFGVGMGNQVRFAAVEHLYQEHGMVNAWQWQPIHNIYLLVASEVGIGGLLASLLFIFALCRPLATSHWSLEKFVSALMLLALLVFGLTDHFLWTLEQGRLLLWFAVGILMGVSPRRDDAEKILPS